jgi:hypothetical protein
MGTPIDKGFLTDEEREQVCGPKLKCPRCGLEAEGLRCTRCNAVKVSGCEGLCSACKTGCSAKRKG